MSDRVEIVRVSFDAYMRGDFDALAEMLHPDLEVHDWPEAADPQVYHGAGAILEAREEWGKAWERVHAEPVDLIENGDRVLAVMRTVGKGRGSSIEVELDTYGVYTFRGAKLAKVQYFTDRQAALDAAGVTEEQTRQEAR
jgi:ketosteroid isomerase-like protein